MDAEQLRGLVGRRVLINFDSGSQVIGRLARCLPDLGAVHLVEIEDATLVSREGVVLRQVASFPLLPATPVGASAIE